MDTILPGASRGAHCLADDLLRLDPALRPSATLAQTHNFFTQEPLPASSESLRPGVNGAHQGDVASERATSSSDIKGVGCTGAPAERPPLPPQYGADFTPVIRARPAVPRRGAEGGAASRKLLGPSHLDSPLTQLALER
jgi:hypothetical protein